MTAELSWIERFWLTTVQRLYSQLQIGSTRTLVGVFQILTGLDLLIDWVNNDFRKWYKSTILTPS